MIVMLRRRKDLDDGNGLSRWFIIQPGQYKRYKEEVLTEEDAQDVIDNYFDAANNENWEYTYNVVPI